MLVALCLAGADFRSAPVFREAVFWENTKSKAAALNHVNFILFSKFLQLSHLFIIFTMSLIQNIHNYLNLFYLRNLLVFMFVLCKP